MSAAAPQLMPPRIGQAWAEHGGIYAGLVAGVDGGPDEHLILGPDVPSRTLKWQDALDWAAELRTSGFSDWHVPTRDESALLYATVRSQIDAGGWYWTSTVHSGSYAWNQLFSGGYQDTCHKSYEGRARAVRRVSAQSFDHFQGAAVAQVGQLRRLAASMTAAADGLECAQQRERCDAEA